MPVPLATGEPASREREGGKEDKIRRKEEDGQVPRGRERKGIRNRGFQKRKQRGEDALNVHFGDV